MDAGRGRGRGGRGGGGQRRTEKDRDIEEDVVEEAVHGTLFPMT